MGQTQQHYHKSEREIAATTHCMCYGSAVYVLFPMFFKQENDENITDLTKQFSIAQIKLTTVIQAWYIRLNLYNKLIYKNI